MSEHSAPRPPAAPVPPPPPPARRSRAVRWAIGVGAAAVTAIGLVLMFLLAQATNNRALYERNYARLFTLNVVVAVLLLLVIGWVALRLWMRLRQGKFGSRLLINLAAIFGLVGLVPGLLIYAVSYQFVTRSIETWFDVKVEGALDAGLNLGRATLDSLAGDLAAKTRAAGLQLADVPDAGAGLVLERIREQLGASDVVLWNGAGQLLASAGASRFNLSPERPSPQQFRQARMDRAISRIEGIDEQPAGAAGAAATPASARALALVQRPGFDFGAEARFLQITQPLPPAVVANALAVQEANREYQERALARDGLRRMYIGTLTLSLFLAVFGAVLLAILFGTQLARPLLVLAEGVRQVAAGDLRPTAVLRGRDELGGLTRSFAVMTQQLADARAAVEQTMARARRGARQPADHPRQPDLGRDRARRRGHHALDQPRRHARAARAAGRLRGPPPGRGAGAARLRARRAAPVRRVRGRARPARAGPLAARLRAAPGRRRQQRGPRRRGARQHHQHRGARRAAAGRRAPAGVRRHLRDRLGPARPGLGRGGAAPGPRDQEPAHADPAVGRAAGDEALGQARAARAGHPPQVGQDHRRRRSTP